MSRSECDKQKRAKSRSSLPPAIRRHTALTLAFGVLAAGLAGALDVGCNAQVATQVVASVDPIGPNGTSAELRYSPFDHTLAVVFSLSGTCWAAGRFNISDGDAWRNSLGLLLSPKSLVW